MRMRTPFALLGLTLLAGGTAFATPASAQAQTFLDRFAGKWEGSGLVRRNLDSGANRVSCRLTGSAERVRATVSGKCRALAIFSRDVTIELRSDDGERFTGRYVGSRIGPAALSGTRAGDALNLTVHWPVPVNGTDTSQMTISTSADGRMRLIVASRPGGSGAPVQTTDISLDRR